MTKPESEFEPLAVTSRIFRYWWVITLLAVAGGIVGFIIHRSKPPLYEAQAIFMASIDYNKVDLLHNPLPTPGPYNFTQYDEDLSLSVVQTSILDVLPEVVDYAHQNGLSVDGTSLLGLSAIEREHAYWYLRFHDPDPALAQKIVNYWAKQAYDDLVAKKQSGQMPTYIYFEMVKTADLPTKPTYFNTNAMVFAGIVIGMVLGVFILSLPIRMPGRGQ